MNRKTLSLLFSVTVISFGIILTGQSNGSESSRALRGFEIKVTAADETDRPAVNTVNGSGVIGDLCDNRWENTWGTATDGDGGANNPNPGTERGATWIKFEFGKIYNIAEMWVWNYNEEIRRGLKNVTIEYTVDGCTWGKFGDYVFAQAPGTVNYAHNTTVDFNGMAVKAVVITAKDGNGIGNYGDPHGMYGLSEVRFYVVKNSHERETVQGNIAPCAKLRLKLERGITIDRQLHSDPPEPWMIFSREDVQLIKSMGFEFVKLIVNPAVFKSGCGLKLSNMWYFDQIVNLVVAETLPVVVCIHPEADFKKSVFGNADEFSQFLSFMEAISHYMAARWTSDQLAFQLMTEPFGSSSNPNDWNYWDKLQHRIWKAVRKQMPDYTLILSGDMAGKIEGLYDITPVNDENVIYSFTFYEPGLFTHQGAPWQPGGIPYLKNLPYPSNLEILESMPKLLSSVPEEFRASLKKDIERYANESWNRKRLAVRIGKLIDWNNYYGGGRLKIWCAEFGCYQNSANSADRCQYINDFRSVLEENKIGWAYWSYNETFSVMISDRTPFGPGKEQTPDKKILEALMPDKFK